MKKYHVSYYTQTLGGGPAWASGLFICKVPMNTEAGFRSMEDHILKSSGASAVAIIAFHEFKK